MSKLNIPKPKNEPSDNPTDLSIQELASFGAAQRSAAQYEMRIRDLRGEVTTYREKSETLQLNLNSQLKFRSKYSEIKRGKIEMAIQLMLVTCLSGLGALLMGMYPRSQSYIPPQFYIGATAISVGIFLGIFVTPVTLCICYLWPKLCKVEID